MRNKYVTYGQTNRAGYNNILELSSESMCGGEVITRIESTAFEKLPKLRIDS